MGDGFFRPHQKNGILLEQNQGRPALILGACPKQDQLLLADLTKSCVRPTSLHTSEIKVNKTLCISEPSDFHQKNGFSNWGKQSTKKLHQRPRGWEIGDAVQSNPPRRCWKHEHEHCIPTLQFVPFLPSAAPWSCPPSAQSPW